MKNPSGQRRLATVHDQVRALGHPEIDVASHPLEVGARDQRPHLGARFVARRDLQRLETLRDARHDRVGDGITDRHRHRDRHAAFAGGAVGRADQRVGHLIEVGVGHDDHVVLRAAQRLHPLAGGRAARIDVLGDRRRPDEADGRDARVVDERVDRFLVAVDDVEHAVGQTGFLEQLGQLDARRRVLLAGLQHERVAAGERHREHPHRHHRREVERRDAGDDPERLADRMAVDAGADLLGELALEQLRDAGGELHHLVAALHLAGGIGRHLAVLGR